MEYSIPAIEQPERCEKRNFISSPFVELIDGNEISVKMQYPLLGMKNAEKKCLLRKEVRDLLLLAQKQLPTALCSSGRIVLFLCTDYYQRVSISGFAGRTAETGNFQICGITG